MSRPLPYPATTSPLLAPPWAPELGAYVQQCAEALGVTLYVLRAGASRASRSHGYGGFPLRSYLRLVNTPYLCTLFGESEGGDVLAVPAVEHYLQDDDSNLTILAVSGEALQGFLVLGAYDPAEDHDSHWPHWDNPRLPRDNTLFREVKLLGAERGVGRLLVAAALLSVPPRSAQALVLEVLGHKHNLRAIALYEAWGFKRERARQAPGGSPVRDPHSGEELVWMVLQAGHGGHFVEQDRCKAALDLQRLKKRDVREGAARDQHEAATAVRSPALAGTPREARRLVRRMPDRKRAREEVKSREGRTKRARYETKKEEVEEAAKEVGQADVPRRLTYTEANRADLGRAGKGGRGAANRAGRAAGGRSGGDEDASGRRSARLKAKN